MAYAAQSDLTPGRIPLKTLAQLTSDATPPEIDPGVVAEKLNDASGLIEMYCRERYALPLQQTQELVTITCNLAIQMLYSRRPGTWPDSVQANYDNALRLLRDVAAKKASLDQPSGIQDQTSSGGPILSRRRPKFSSRNLEGFE